MMKSIFGLLLLTIVFSAIAFADIPGGKRVPKPEPNVTPVDTPPAARMNQIDAGRANMYIAIGPSVEGPTLVIDKSLLDRLNEAVKTNGGSTTGVRYSLGGTPTQTIVAGIFMSLALVFGGLWFAKAKGPLPRTAVGALLCAILAAGATFVFANAGLPPRVRIMESIFDKKVKGKVTVQDKVNIRIVDRMYPDDINLLVPETPVEKTKEDE